MVCFEKVCLVPAPLQIEVHFFASLRRVVGLIVLHNRVNLFYVLELQIIGCRCDIAFEQLQGRHQIIKEILTYALPQ